MNAKLILVAASLICPPALAERFQTVASDAQETVLLDTANVRESGDERLVRVIRDYQQRQLNQFDGEWYAHKSKVVTYRVDCQARQIAFVEWSLHGSSQGRGQALYQGKARSPMYQSGTRNLGEVALMDAVCTTQVAQSQPQNVLASAEDNF